jgi:hypothetical protein
MDDTFQITEKHITILELMRKYESQTNIEYAKSILEDIGLLIELIDSLNKQNIKMPEWKIWHEPLLIKLCFHASSLLQIFSGTTLPFNDRDKLLEVFDEASIIVLLRVVTENYLTFHFLFADDIPEEEKRFRVTVWKYCGLKQRSNFEISTEEAKKKQLKENADIELLKLEIEKSSFFNSFHLKHQKKILNGKNPRLFNTWIDLIKGSDLRLDLFKNMYGYKSNYSHSEFISVMQLRSSNYGYNENAKNHYALFLLHFLISKTILDLNEIFPSIKDIFSSKTKIVTNRIEALVWYATTKEFDSVRHTPKSTSE